MIGKLMVERRHALGLSQTELARRAGSSQRQVSRLENDEEEKIPRKDTLERFGAVLGITLAEFYQAAGHMPTPEELGNAPPPLPSALEEVMRQMQRDHPELVEQFDRRRGDPDFAAQVRDLARVLNYSLRGYLGE